MKATNEDGSAVRPMRLHEVADVILPVGKAYRGPNGLRVIIAREQREWHISLSHPDRYPTWDEIRDVCWTLKPRTRFKVIVPAANEPYTNFHPYTMHVWEEHL